MSVTRSQRVFVALVAQHAMHLSRVVMRGLVWLYRIFPQYLLNGTIGGKMLLNIKCVF